MPDQFEVQVTGLENYAETGRGLVFHAINKSGSLALTDVLADAYYAAGRANQFFSTYRYVPRKLDRLRSVIAHSSGHSFYGAHDLYASVPADPERRMYVTQFRNPLPRARSCYQWLVNQHDLEVPFEKWVIGTKGLRHSQVVQLGIGYGVDAVDWRTLPGDEILERAIANIERDVAWFGIAEYLEETAFTMAALCGLPTIGAWQRDARNENRALVPDWPQHEVDLVKEVFRWDFQLYAWAVERFEAALAGLQFGPELERYRDACADQYNDRLDVEGRVLPPTAGACAGDVSPTGRPRRQWGRRAPDHRPLRPDPRA